MSNSSAEKPKDRIVSVAANLFSSHGINVIGVDRICLEANVSKRTLYKYFPSKEALVSAAITSLGESWFDACTNTNLDNPIDRITHIFKMVEPMAQVNDFYGCILMNTSIELRGSDDLALEAAKDFKSRLLAYFQQQATLIGAKNPDTLAQQLIVLYDGTSAWIAMRRAFPASTFQTLDILLRSASPSLQK